MEEDNKKLEWELEQELGNRSKGGEQKGMTIIVFAIHNKLIL